MDLVRQQQQRQLRRQPSPKLIRKLEGQMPHPNKKQKDTNQDLAGIGRHAGQEESISGIRSRMHHLVHNDDDRDQEEDDEDEVRSRRRTRRKERSEEQKETSIRESLDKSVRVAGSLLRKRRATSVQQILVTAVAASASGDGSGSSQRRLTPVNHRIDHGDGGEEEDGDVFADHMSDRTDPLLIESPARGRDDVRDAQESASVHSLCERSAASCDPFLPPAAATAAVAKRIAGKSSPSGIGTRKLLQHGERKGCKNRILCKCRSLTGDRTTAADHERKKTRCRSMPVAVIEDKFPVKEIVKSGTKSGSSFSDIRMLDDPIDGQEKEEQQMSISSTSLRPKAGIFDLSRQLNQGERKRKRQEGYRREAGWKEEGEEGEAGIQQEEEERMEKNRIDFGVNAFACTASCCSSSGSSSTAMPAAVLSPPRSTSSSSSFSTSSASFNRGTSFSPRDRRQAADEQEDKVVKKKAVVDPHDAGMHGDAGTGQQEEEDVIAKLEDESASQVGEKQEEDEDDEIWSTDVSREGKDLFLIERNTQQQEQEQQSDSTAAVSSAAKITPPAPKSFATLNKRTNNLTTNSPPVSRTSHHHPHPYSLKQRISDFVKNPSGSGSRSGPNEELDLQANNGRTNSAPSKSRKHGKKKHRRIKFRNTSCNLDQMNCFTHDNDHWKTPPLWTGNSLSLVPLFVLSACRLPYAVLYIRCCCSCGLCCLSITTSLLLQSISLDDCMQLLSELQLQ